MRIDMHVHYMPPEARRDKSLYAKEPFWQLLLDETDGKSVQGWASVERMLDDMDRARIDRAVIQGEYFQTHEATVRKNDLVLQVIRESSGRLLGFAAIQPKAGQTAIDELKRCLDGGMVGVGEISPYAQSFSLENIEFLRFTEKCIEYNIPLLLHTNDEVGRYYKGKVPIPISQYYEYARRFPELKLILAHWGGGLFMYEIVPAVRQVLENVMYDTAASPLTYPTQSIFRAALACVPASKILYASDYPLLVYPRKQTEPDLISFVSEIGSLGLERNSEDQIMGENASRLLASHVDRDASRDKRAEPNAGVERKHVGRIDRSTSVSLIAHTFPKARQVLAQYGIAYDDSAALWEPIGQSAAAHGLGSRETDVLLSELNEAIQAQREK